MVSRASKSTAKAEQPALRLLTVLQVAQIVQLSTKTIGRYIDDGSIPGLVRLPGGGIRFRETDIHEWIDSLSQPHDEHEE
jgi:excisionase family DNA binding protein